MTPDGQKVVRNWAIAASREGVALMIARTLYELSVMVRIELVENADGGTVDLRALNEISHRLASRLLAELREPGSGYPLETLGEIVFETARLGGMDRLVSGAMTASTRTNAL